MRISKASVLIDIFSDSTSSEEIESGNVTPTFSGYLLQFIFLPNCFSKLPVTKSNIWGHVWKKI